MNLEALTNHLVRAGWQNFAAGKFFDLDFDSLGTAKIAKNSWSILVKSLPVLDAAAIDLWNAHYKTLIKKTPAGFFNSGKYFVLVLVVETISPDGLEKLNQAGTIGFLEMPSSILRGGGYTLLLIKDRGKIFMPKTVALPPLLGFTETAKATHRALESYAASQETA